jgi:hypothetical protein
VCVCVCYSTPHARALVNFWSNHSSRQADQNRILKTPFFSCNAVSNTFDVLTFPYAAALKAWKEAAFVRGYHKAFS